MKEHCWCGCGRLVDVPEPPRKEDRMKVRIVKATPVFGMYPWYAQYVGQPLWISRHTYDATNRTYNLKWGPTFLKVAAADVTEIPASERKQFHAINDDLPLFTR